MIADLLRRAGSTRTVGELTDLANWIAYDEAEALWRAGCEVTHHPRLAEVVGRDSARRLAATPTAATLRSLGSPERVYEQISLTSRKYSSVSDMQLVFGEPGYAHLRARPLPGYPRSAAHCEWTTGLMACMVELFGLPPADVEHTACAALGASSCDYHVRWLTGPEMPRSSAMETALRAQIAAQEERLRGVYQTASELVGSGDISEVLGHIARRAALEVRAPRHLLAVEIGPDDARYVLSEGFTPDDAVATAEELLHSGPDTSLGRSSWLSVPVESTHRRYGMLAAAYAEGNAFLPEERELFEVYAYYAASALDGASALLDSEARAGQSSALLGLARSLAIAGTVEEIISRLCDAIPQVVDCDAVSLLLRDGDAVVRAGGSEPGRATNDRRWEASENPTLRRMFDDPVAKPVCADPAQTSQDDVLRALGGAAAVALVPLVSSERLIGVLALTVRDRPERLRSSSDLHDRLSGIGAQAATALENARLIDLITHQATHDQLTGLANRTRFNAALNEAVNDTLAGGPTVGILYIDLDGFKPINDVHGHDVGDQLLAAVAERLLTCLGTEGLAARLGGDEFAIIATVDGAAALDALNRRVAGCFTDPFILRDLTIDLRASVGSSLHSDNGPHPEEVLRRADKAMLAVKRSHSDRRNGSPVPAVVRAQI